MSSRPRLVLHIGYPKTGTTSIQTFLQANREALRRRGVLYPQAGLLDAAHRLLSTVFYAASARENQAPRHLARLLGEIDAARCGAVVLSFEGFCHDHPSLFDPLRERFDTTVVIYLRRQDHIAESLYAQHVRSVLNQECRPAAEACRESRYAPDYRRILALYAAAFGRDRLAVRVFERGQLEGGDLVADFLAAAGIPRDPAFAGSTSANTSLKRPYLAFKRHCNLLALLDEEQRRLNQNLNRLSKEDPGPALGHLLSPDNRRAILASREASNRAVAAEFLGRADGILFREPPPADDEPWEPLAPLDPDAQHRLFDRLDPENQERLAFVHRPARLALPGEPVLPDLPDGDPAQLAQLVENRTMRQFQRRLAVLERRLGERGGEGGPG